jgi:protein-disulfide isomerase
MELNTEKKIILGIIGVTILLLVGGVVFLSKQPSSPRPSQVSQANQALLVKDNSNQTNKDGKIAVVEFADYQCPSCGSVYPIVKQLMHDYKDRVNFVFRHFPLSQHKNAFSAAYAAEASGAQGKFWEMEDKLFTNQSNWSEVNNPKDIFAGYAKDIGIDEERFKNDYDNKVGEDKIRSDQNDGISLGVDSTPTFFINGKKYTGGMPLDKFKSIIDEELKGK